MIHTLLHVFYCNTVIHSRQARIASEKGWELGHSLDAVDDGEDSLNASGPDRRETGIQSPQHTQSYIRAAMPSNNNI